MNDELTNSPRTLHDFNKEMERIRRSIEPSVIGLNQQINRALEPLRERHFEMVRVVERMEENSSRVVDIFRANDRCLQVLRDMALPNQTLTNIASVHQTWMESVSGIQERFAQIDAAAKISFGEIAGRLTVSEAVWARVDFESIQRSLRVSEEVTRSIQNSLTHFTSGYRRLTESFDFPSRFIELPEFAFPGATREVFLTAQSIEVFQESEEPDSGTDESELLDEIDIEVSWCIDLLEQLDPALAKPYIGARQAFHAQSADRARHVLVSLRELWNHLLRRVAPDEQVMNWMPKEKESELLHEGRPVRKARILYVCRDLDHPPFSDFLHEDTRALIELIRFFNRVHELDANLTDRQLRALLRRADSWLMFILQTWNESR